MFGELGWWAGTPLHRRTPWPLQRAGRDVRRHERQTASAPVYCRRYAGTPAFLGSYRPRAGMAVARNHGRCADPAKEPGCNPGLA